MMFFLIKFVITSNDHWELGATWFGMKVLEDVMFALCKVNTIKGFRCSCAYAFIIKHSLNLNHCLTKNLMILSFGKIPLEEWIIVFAIIIFKMGNWNVNYWHTLSLCETLSLLKTFCQKYNRAIWINIIKTDWTIPAYQLKTMCAI